jgi:Transglycosylase SLT domain
MVWVGALVLLPAVRPAAAALVVLTGGEVVKSASAEVLGETIRVTFESGGSMTLPLLRVERVLDDEVEPRAAQEPLTAPPAALFDPRFSPQQPVPSELYGAVIYAAAQRHALNPALIAAVVRVESAGRASAVSPKGACGLMQIMPATGQRFGLRRAELFDAAKNVDAGSRYLAWLLERYDDDVAKSLAAYNAGEGTVDRYGGVPPYRETRGYVRRIFGLLGLDENSAVARAPLGKAAPPAVQITR